MTRVSAGKHKYCPQGGQFSLFIYFFIAAWESNPRLGALGKSCTTELCSSPVLCVYRFTSSTLWEHLVRTSLVWGDTCTRLPRYTYTTRVWVVYGNTHSFQILRAQECAGMTHRTLFSSCGCLGCVGASRIPPGRYNHSWSVAFCGNAAEMLSGVWGEAGVHLPFWTPPTTALSPRQLYLYF